MYGWHGRLLRVNLTNGTIEEEAIPEEEARKYIGGRGLAIKYLMEGMDPKVDPLSPENLLIMATGPLTMVLNMTPNEMTSTIWNQMLRYPLKKFAQNQPSFARR